MRDDVVGGDRLPAVRAGHGRGEEFPAGPMLETHRGYLLRRHPAIAPGNADPGVSPYIRGHAPRASAASPDAFLKEEPVLTLEAGGCGPRHPTIGDVEWHDSRTTLMSGAAASAIARCPCGPEVPEPNRAPRYSSGGSTRIRTMRSLTTWLARSLLIGVAGLGWGNSRAPGSCSTVLVDDAASGRVSRHAPTRVAVNTTTCSCPEIKCGRNTVASCSVMCEAPSKARCTCASCSGPPVNQIIGDNLCVCRLGL